MIQAYTPLTTNAFSNSNYRHVALTISGNTHTLYLDGSVVADNSNGLNVFQFPISKLLIGCAADLSYGYTGIIDDFKIWNRALPASDISSIYNSVTFMTKIMAIDYFPLITNYNNSIVKSTTSLSASTSANVSIATILTKSCATFTSNAYLISSSTTLQLPISFCFWCYLPIIASTNQLLSIGNGSFAGNSACLQTDVLNNGSFNIYIGLPVFWTSLSVGGINNNKWSHLCYTISSTNATVYVDGVSKATSYGTFSWLTLSSYKYILGRAADGSARYLNGGGIRHFARFNRILSSTEISDIMNITI